MPQPIKPQKPPMEVVEKKHTPEVVKVKTDSFLSKFQKDDLILVAVLVALLLEDCEDKMLIAVIAGLLLFDT